MVTRHTDRVGNTAGGETFTFMAGRHCQRMTVFIKASPPMSHSHPGSDGNSGTTDRPTETGTFPLSRHPTPVITQGRLVFLTPALAHHEPLSAYSRHDHRYLKQRHGYESHIIPNSFPGTPFTRVRRK